MIAGEVRRHRQRLKLSAQQLADRTAELGHPLSRDVLTNLENGRRPAVSTADLVVLGAALEVAPVQLLFPVGRVETVEALPGRTVPPWDALRWFSGERDVEGLPDRPVVTAPELWRLHAAHVGNVVSARVGVDRAVAAMARTEADRAEAEQAKAQPGWEEEDEPSALRLARMGMTQKVDLQVWQQAVSRLDLAEQALRAFRGDLRRLGFIAPQLHPNLADIDEPSEGQGGAR
ncbi:helix-turn-helix domain-containing protein [Frankia sp. AgW1.1]|nr:helix-turn-helix domain-containing protein [Frankia sp. AgW1.1]MBL7618566.1 helix-turn-helix domain-containing protein [Frankia sp. AgB1.8]